ncbi:MAG: YihY/virulence factor BrkB family protein, partial [Bdellovibrionota bacterium]
VLSLAPLSVVMLFTFSRLDPDLLSHFVDEMQSLVGDAGGAAIGNAINSARSRPITGGLASLVSLLVMLVSASAMFAETRASLAILLRSPPDKRPRAGILRETWGVIRDRLLSMGFALTTLLIMAISLLISAFLSAAAQRAGFLRIEMPVSFMLYAALFTLLLMYGAKPGLKFRDSLRGGALTSALFLIGKSLIGLYIGRSSVANAYGAAGSVVALLVWIYYAVIIVFSGAHVAWLLAGRRYRSYGHKKPHRVTPLAPPKRSAG